MQEQQESFAEAEAVLRKFRHTQYADSTVSHDNTRDSVQLDKKEVVMAPPFSSTNAPPPRMLGSRRGVVKSASSISIRNQSSGGFMQEFFKKGFLIALVVLVFQIIGQGVSVFFLWVQGFTLPILEKQIELTERINKLNSSTKPQLREVALPTFSCTTTEAMKAGFEKATPVKLDQETITTIPSGCMVITGARVDSLEGSKYALAQDDPINPGKYIGCGNIGDWRDSHEDCRRFLSSRAGQQVKIVVQNGGYLTFIRKG